jgi:hypothetical protein
MLETLMDQIVTDYVLEINKDDPSGALTAIEGKSYGSTKVTVSMAYITFNTSGAEQAVPSPGKSSTLKVTVTRNDTGSSLTTLLTESRLPGSPASPRVEL